MILRVKPQMAKNTIFGQVSHSDHDKGQISARQVPSVTRDRRIDIESRHVMLEQTLTAMGPRNGGWVARIEPLLLFFRRDRA